MHKAVHTSGGNFAVSHAEFEERWEEYFAELFRGSVVAELPEQLSPLIVLPQDQHGKYSIEDMLRILMGLGLHKALGPDTISAELAVAGGAYFAAKFSAF